MIIKYFKGESVFVYKNGFDMVPQETTILADHEYHSDLDAIALQFWNIKDSKSMRRCFFPNSLDESEKYDLLNDLYNHITFHDYDTYGILQFMRSSYLGHYIEKPGFIPALFLVRNPKLIQKLSSSISPEQLIQLRKDDNAFAIARYDEFKKIEKEKLELEEREKEQAKVRRLMEQLTNQDKPVIDVSLFQHKTLGVPLIHPEERLSGEEQLEWNILYLNRQGNPVPDDMIRKYFQYKRLNDLIYDR